MTKKKYLVSLACLKEVNMEGTFEAESKEEALEMALRKLLEGGLDEKDDVHGKTSFNPSAKGVGGGIYIEEREE